MKFPLSSHPMPIRVRFRNEPVFVMPRARRSFFVFLVMLLGALVLSPAATLDAAPVPAFDAPVEGNVTALVEGTYESVDQEAVLRAINALREEAADEGLAASYRALTWSDGLEAIARTRAAEAVILPDHVRPRGGRTPFMRAFDGMRNTAENLAWNERGLLRGIEQFAAEKPAYEAALAANDWTEKASAPFSHYRALIADSLRTVGAASFYSPETGVYQVTVVFSTAEDSHVEPLPAPSAPAPVELSASRLAALRLSLSREAGGGVEEGSFRSRSSEASTGASVVSGTAWALSAEASLRREDVFSGKTVLMDAPIVAGLRWSVSPQGAAIVHSMPGGASSAASVFSTLRVTFPVQGTLTLAAEAPFRTGGDGDGDGEASSGVSRSGVRSTLAVRVSATGGSDPSSEAGAGDGKDSGSGTGAAGPALRRVAAPRREAVAAHVARTWFADAETILIVNREAYGDAMSAANLSRGSAPILYTNAASLPDETRLAILDLQPRQIIIVGGPKSISPEVESVLRRLVSSSASAAHSASIQRISGADRYEVNAQTLSGRRGGWIAVSGQVFSDALVAAPLAVQNDAEVALIQPDRVPVAIAEPIRRLGGSVTVVGGSVSVQPQTLSQLEDLSGSTVPRMGGANRYTLSARIAASFDAPQALLASGEIFSDALVAAPLAQKLRAPILLTPGIRLPEQTLSTARTFRNLLIIGGPATISEEALAVLK